MFFPSRPKIVMLSVSNWGNTTRIPASGHMREIGIPAGMALCGVDEHEQQYQMMLNLSKSRFFKDDFMKGPAPTLIVVKSYTEI